MITHVIVKLDAPIEEKYWEYDYIFSNEYYGIGKPLIRCKDCKHYSPEGHVHCWNIRGMHFPVEPDEFCSRAERKEE